jgi:hypothetical protein
MVRLKNMNQTRNPGQSASDYYRNKRLYWIIEQIVDEHNKQDTNAVKEYFIKKWNKSATDTEITQEPNKLTYNTDTNRPNQV